MAAPRVCASRAAQPRSPRAQAVLLVIPHSYRSQPSATPPPASPPTTSCPRGAVAFTRSSLAPRGLVTQAEEGGRPEGFKDREDAASTPRCSRRRTSSLGRVARRDGGRPAAPRGQAAKAARPVREYARHSLSGHNGSHTPCLSLALHPFCDSFPPARPWGRRARAASRRQGSSTPLQEFFSWPA